MTSQWTEKNITWFNQLKISTEELLILNGVKRYDEAFLLDVTGYIEKKIKRDPGVYGLVIDFNDPLSRIVPLDSVLQIIRIESFGQS